MTHTTGMMVGCLVVALVTPARASSGGANAPSCATPAPSTTAPVEPAEPAGPTLPTVPESDRIDLDQPTFSDPTTVDNALFPISEQHSAVLLGNDDGHPLRVEITLLPEPLTIEWDGRCTETLVSQFVSYVDGRLHEIALDSYAQADDSAVWFFGEDVFRYEDGVVLDKEGTWYAGQDGPAAMIMPADPQIGDVFRSENIPGSLLEEVVVQSVGVTVSGPRGPVEGSIVGQEWHILEGVRENKTFAPGYGEFTSGVDGGIETMALSVPTDALAGPVPAELTAVEDRAIELAAQAGSGDWEGASATLESINTAWASYREDADVPELLALQMDRALDLLAGNPLSPAVDARNRVGASNAAIDVAQASLDLQLPYRPVPEVNLARFDLWARQVLVDAGSEDPDPGHVAGDVTVLEWVWDRIAHTLDESAVSDIEAQLGELRAAADAEDTGAALDLARALVETLISIET